MFFRIIFTCINLIMIVKSFSRGEGSYDCESDSDNRAFD